MDLRLLGPVDARVDGRPVELGPPKQRAVLAMLALRAGRTVSADRLVEGLWGEQPPASATKMVQLYVSQLRRVLDGNGAQIVTRGRGYELQLADGEVDAIQFERLLEQDRAREALDAVARRGARRPRGRAIRRRRDPATGRAAPARERAGDRRRPRGRAPRRGDRRARGAGRRAPAARATARPADARALSLRPPVGGARRLPRRARRCWSSRSASSRAPSCSGCSARSWPMTRRSSFPRRRARARHAGPASAASPRAPVVAIAALLLLAGVVAFGISRVTGPDEPCADRRELRRADRRRQRPDHGPVQRRARPGGGRRRRRLGVGRQPAGRDRLADRPRAPRGRDDPRRGRADRTRIRRRVAVGRRRPGPHGRPDRPQASTRSCSGSRSATPPPPSPSATGAVWVASAVDATVVRIDLASGEASKPIDVGGATVGAGGGGRGDLGRERGRRRASCALDPRSGTPLARIPVGNGPSGVAVGAGAVWVANRSDGTVSRIDPTPSR